MNKKVRAKKIVSLIKKEYPKAKTELLHKNPWQLAVSVALSAMSTDVSVNKVTPALFKKYSKPVDLANARVSDIEKIVKTVNFYKTKAKNIRGMAQKLVSDFGGEVPKTMEELLTLPGVARKSANVILEEAFGLTEGIVVDTHVSRVSSRLKLTKNSDPKKIEKDLMKIIPKKDWGVWGSVLVSHGRYICTARKPKCTDCILNKLCPSAFSFD